MFELAIDCIVKSNSFLLTLNDTLLCEIIFEMGRNGINVGLGHADQDGRIVTVECHVADYLFGLLNEMCFLALEGACLLHMLE